MSLRPSVTLFYRAVRLGISRRTLLAQRHYASSPPPPSRHPRPQTEFPDPIPPKGWIPPRRPPLKADFPKTRIAAGVAFTAYIIYVMFFDTSLREDNQPIKAQAPPLAERDSLLKQESGVSESSPMRLRMEAFIKQHQRAIVEALEKVEFEHAKSIRSNDVPKFQIDEWIRPNNGGGGISCVLQNGNVFEKAGVNISIVYGKLPQPAIQRMRADHKRLDPSVESLDFFAAGISLVLHPQNPMAPTVHLNYRYFETSDPTNNNSDTTWWFGGGSDLTPAYLFDEDAIAFHAALKRACDKHDKTYYTRFKRWCDEYFRNTHRNEARGVGGIFFDDLDDASATTAENSCGTTKDREQLFSFVQDCLGEFLPSYLPVLLRRKDAPYTEHEKRWQQLRRGRYVEFNLVHDRGTSFGLSTPNARVESILMSLPLTARWEYMHGPEPGSREERLLGVLRTPVDWL